MPPLVRRVIAAVLIALALGAGFALLSQRPGAERVERKVAMTPAPAATAVTAAAPVPAATDRIAPAPGIGTPVPATAAGAVVRTEPGTVFERFNEWALAYLHAPESARAALVARGEAIAAERQAALARLIPDDPRRALENAVPMAVRQQLPPEIGSLLEERVNARGFYGVLGVIGAPPDQPPVRREVRLDDGRRFEAHVFGRRLAQMTTEKAALAGIAVPIPEAPQRSMLALDERPLRVLEPGEIPDPAKPVVETCPVSGKSTAVPRAGGALPSITEESPAVEIGGVIHYLCSGGHIIAVEEQLVAEEGGSGGAIKPTGAVPGSQSTGVRSLLYMRVAYADTHRDPQTETAAYDMMRQVNDWFVENSFGNVHIVPTITPLLVLPRTEAWYTSATGGDEFTVRTDAQNLARRLGYDTSSYDLDIVVYTGGPGSFGGLAYVGGKGVWLKSITVGVACHELGHNFGLWHANSWNTAGQSIIGNGSNSEYGNLFDTMGSASAGDLHFNANHKAKLSWLPSQSFVANVLASGVYRIFAFDQPRLDPANRYALRVRKDSGREYWAEFRQRSLSSNRWTRDGIVLNWSPWANSNGGAQLLDTTPGSADGRTDSPLTIGRTFSDSESGIHITPIAKAGTTPEAMDVVVNLGNFAGNRAPTVKVSASAPAVAANVTVNFTAAANDPDGDAMSFAWDFGDKAISNTNSPTVSKSWSTAGDYAVRCTVSDMKGRTASATVLVTVGSPGTFRISGRVTANGQPLADVRVSNGLTGTSYRGALTDSDGTYTIPGLSAGGVTLGAVLYGWSFTAGFTNPVTVGPNVTGADFTAGETPAVTIAASDPDATEGAANPGHFLITRTGSTESALTVNLLYPSGTATLTTDYTLSPALTAVSPYQTLTIPAGQASFDVGLNAVDDTGAEGPESAVLEIAPGAGYVIGSAPRAVVTIQDGDSALPVVGIRVTDVDANETGDTAAFSVYRNGPAANPLVVKFAVSGTAASGSDFASLGAQVTIPAGASSAPLVVTPVNDSLAEGDETVTVTISSDAAYIKTTNPAEAAGAVNVLDDDIPTLTVTASDATAAEGGSDTGTFLITRTGDTSQPLTVYYAIIGSAHQGVDYLPLPGVLTIPAGSSTGAVTVTPIDDGLGEPAQTVILQLRAGAGFIAGNPGTATVTLNDNTDLPVVTVDVLDGVAGEPGDAGTFRFTTTGTGSGNITVRYTVTGTATPGSDYAALSGTLSMAKNATATVTVTPIDDAELENLETVTVTIDPDPGYTIFLDTSATLHLTDNDQPAVNVSTTTSVPAEPATTGKFWISRTGAKTGALDVNYSMSGTATNGQDYNTLSGLATIPDGAAGVSVDIVPLNDAIAEGAETVVLTIVPGSYGIGVASATHYLGDNDTLAVQVRFSTSTGSASESAGTIDVPVTLSAASASAVSVEYVIGGGSAIAGIDFTAPSGVLVFAPGETSKTIPLTILDDTFIEPSQTVILKLQNANGGSLGTSAYTCTITDNDTAPGRTIGFAATAASGVESLAAAPVVVSLSAAAAAPVTVDYTVTGGTAAQGEDYTIAGGTRTFAAGETAKLLPLTIIDDASAESSETIIITLSNAVGATPGGNAMHTYTILDNDSQTVTIVAGDASASETPGNPGQFTVTRAGSTASALTVNLAFGGTATYGADYQAIAATLTIAAGQASATLTVTPIDDARSEPTETVIAGIASGGAYAIGVASSATVTIADDEPIVSITAIDPNAAEFGLNPGTFQVSRTGSTAGDLTVQAGVSGSATPGSDYTPLTLPVLIPAGAASAMITVTPLADSLAEGPETVGVQLSGTANYTLGASTSAMVGIADLPIDDWRFAKFGAQANNPALAALDADPDGDRISNLLEFALAGDPLSASTMTLPEASVGNGEIVLRYRRPVDAGGVMYQVEEKQDFAQPWVPAAAVDEIVADDGVTRTMRAHVPVGGAAKKIIRLRVSQP